MSLQLRIIAITAFAILGCAVLWPFYACAARTEVAIVGEGVLTVAINCEDGPLQITLAEDAVNRQKVTTESYYAQAGSGNAYRSQGDVRSSELPQNLVGPQRHLDAPFEVGDRNGILIATVYPDEKPPRILSEEFAMVDVKNTRLAGIVRAGAKILSLKWSPSNRYFSVLLAEDVPGPIWNVPLRWIAKSLGHPITYTTISLAMYGDDGRLLPRKVLATRLRGGTGYIAGWSK